MSRLTSVPRTTLCVGILLVNYRFRYPISLIFTSFNCYRRIASDEPLPQNITQSVKHLRQLFPYVFKTALLLPHACTQFACQTLQPHEKVLEPRLEPQAGPKILS